MRSSLLVASVCLAILAPSVVFAAADPSRAPIHHRHRVATRTSPHHRHGPTARQEGDKSAKHKEHVSRDSEAKVDSDKDTSSKESKSTHKTDVSSEHASKHSHDHLATEKSHEHKDSSSDSHAAKTDKSSEPPPELSGALPQSHHIHAGDKHHDKDATESKHHDRDKDATESKHHGREKDATESKHHKTVDDGDNHASVDERLGKHHSLKKCLAPVVHFARQGGLETTALSLTTCDGRVNSSAIEELSFIGRPLNVERAEPAMHLASQHDDDSDIENDWEIAPGVRRIHPGLVDRMQKIADQFPAKTITVISGYRPQSVGSPHADGRAFDIQIEGVTNETLVAFCRTLQDTGCGYYPNSTFVHVDVRAPGTGPIYWIDISGPGEPAKYVKSWPNGGTTDSHDDKADLHAHRLPQLPPVQRTVYTEGFEP